MPWKGLYGTDKRTLLKKMLSKGLTSMLSYNYRAISRYADGHIVSASQCRNFLNEQMGISQECIAVIPQAPPDSFNNTSVSTITGERLKRILYIAQFAFFKAPMIVAKVINKLAESDYSLQFTWICSKEHHPEVEKILSNAALERIVLLDWMPQYELMKVYDKHGIFLFPSFFEGFGKAFLEAMARGLCVIAADNGGAHDVISNGKDGILVPTGSVEKMVLSCLEILNNPSIGASLSTEAVKTAQAYTWERVARETVSFYQKILNIKSNISERWEIF
jgi:glycosyltransferase involved in cell wall biosynthesis